MHERGGCARPGFEERVIRGAIRPTRAVDAARQRGARLTIDPDGATIRRSAP
jgi:hypothetical protein